MRRSEACREHRRSRDLRSLLGASAMRVTETASPFAPNETTALSRRAPRAIALATYEGRPRARLAGRESWGVNFFSRRVATRSAERGFRLKSSVRARDPSLRPGERASHY